MFGLGLGYEAPLKPTNEMQNMGTRSGKTNKIKAKENLSLHKNETVLCGKSRYYFSNCSRTGDRGSGSTGVIPSVTPPRSMRQKITLQENEYFDIWNLNVQFSKDDSNEAHCQRQVRQAKAFESLSNLASK